MCQWLCSLHIGSSTQTIDHSRACCTCRYSTSISLTQKIFLQLLWRVAVRIDRDKHGRNFRHIRCLIEDVDDLGEFIKFFWTDIRAEREAEIQHDLVRNAVELCDKVSKKLLKITRNQLHASVPVVQDSWDCNSILRNQTLQLNSLNFRRVWCKQQHLPHTAMVSSQCVGYISMVYSSSGDAQWHNLVYSVTPDTYTVIVACNTNDALSLSHNNVFLRIRRIH